MFDIETCVTLRLNALRCAACQFSSKLKMATLYRIAIILSILSALFSFLECGKFVILFPKHYRIFRSSLVYIVKHWRSISASFPWINLIMINTIL